MKKIFTLVLLAAYSIVFSQNENDKKIYLDSLNRETSDENFMYYRLIKNFNKKQKEYRIEDYYKSGKIKETGIITNLVNFTRNGEFVSFYENGHKKQIVNYKSSMYHGKFQEWYENGNPKLEAEYLQYEKTDTVYPNGLKVINYWNENKNQIIFNGNGDYYESYKDFYSQGRLKNGYKEGEWSGKNDYKKYTFIETYKNGRFIEGKSTDSLGIKRDYKQIMTTAMSEKGVKDFQMHIIKNTKSPENLKIRGRVVIEFTVTLEGVIKNVKVIKSLHPLFDQEAINVIKSYKEKWSTAYERGIATESKFMVPIVFDIR